MFTMFKWTDDIPIVTTQPVKCPLHIHPSTNTNTTEYLKMRRESDEPNVGAYFRPHWGRDYF